MMKLCSHPCIKYIESHKAYPATLTPNQSPHLPTTSTSTTSSDTFLTISSHPPRGVRRVQLHTLLLWHVTGRVSPETAAGELVCHQVGDESAGMWCGGPQAEDGLGKVSCLRSFLTRDHPRCAANCASSPAAVTDSHTLQVLPVTHVYFTRTLGRKTVKPSAGNIFEKVAFHSIYAQRKTPNTRGVYRDVWIKTASILNSPPLTCNPIKKA